MGRVLPLPRPHLAPGTGIGLTLVRALVSLQHGDVWFDSQPRGSRVGFNLPRATPGDAPGLREGGRLDSLVPVPIRGWSRPGMTTTAASWIA